MFHQLVCFISALVQRVTQTVHLIDPTTLNRADITDKQFWKECFNSIATTKQMIEFTVMDIGNLITRYRHHRLSSVFGLASVPKSLHVFLKSPSDHLLESYLLSLNSLSFLLCSFLTTPPLLCVQIPFRAIIASTLRWETCPSATFWQTLGSSAPPNWECPLTAAMT